MFLQAEMTYFLLLNKKGDVTQNVRLSLHLFYGVKRGVRSTCATLKNEVIYSPF